LDKAKVLFLLIDYKNDVVSKFPYFKERAWEDHLIQDEIFFIDGEY